MRQPRSAALSRAVLLVLFALVALVVVPATGCVDSPAFRPFNNDETLRAALSPDSTVLLQESGGYHEANAKVYPLANHDFVALVNPYPDSVVFDDAYRSVAVVRSGASGLQTAVLPAARTAVVSLGDEVLILYCRDIVNFAISDPTHGIVELSTVGNAGFYCGGPTGPGFAPDTLIQTNGSTLSRATLDRGAKTVTVSDEQPPDGFTQGGFLFLDEPEAGVIAFLSLTDDTLTYHRGSVVHTPTGITGSLEGVSAWRAPDGSLRVVTGDGLFRWDPDTTDQVTKLAPIPAPLDGAPWKITPGHGSAVSEQSSPNPDAPREVIPSRSLVRYVDNDAFVTFEPSPTPCCSRDACREAAESYVLGGVQNGTSTVVLFDMWTWAGSEEHVFVAAKNPLSCGP